MKFTKMQATGNDFVVVEAWGIKRDWSAMARIMCQRRLGIGADGLILVLLSHQADFGMRIFNPDGSEAEACGNGIRCFVQYVIDKKLTEKRELNIEMLTGIKKAKENSGLIQVAMGVPRFAPYEIPVNIETKDFPVLDYEIKLKNGKLKASFVSIGNPHAVCFVDRSVDDFPLSEIGPQVELHPLFPNRTNLEVVNVSNQRKLKVRVWERGAGETLSCGSGACAAAVIARIKNLVEDKMEVEFPGGKLNVNWDKRGEIWLGGSAEAVFEGKWLQCP